MKPPLPPTKNKATKEIVRCHFIEKVPIPPLGLLLPPCSFPLFFRTYPPSSLLFRPDSPLFSLIAHHGLMKNPAASFVSYRWGSLGPASRPSFLPAHLPWPAPPRHQLGWARKAAFSRSPQWLSEVLLPVLGVGSYHGTVFRGFFFPL